MIKVALICVVFACAFYVQVDCATISWTGAQGNGLWNFATNWSPNTVPTAADDVTINAAGGATVTVSQPSVARSIVVGGNNAAQTLVLVNQLTVGGGGIRVQARGTINVNTNDALPLSTSGYATFSAGSHLLFTSGAIYGPGDFIVAARANLTFATAAEKRIAATNLTSEGSTVIQASLIQFSARGTLRAFGGLHAFNGITLLSDDYSRYSLYVTGSFTYEGDDVNKPLTIMASSLLASGLNITRGKVSIGNMFLAGKILASNNATLEVLPEAKGYLSNVTAANVVVGGTAEFNGRVESNLFAVTASGAAVMEGNSSIRDAVIIGKVNTSSSLDVQNLHLNGGSLGSKGRGYFNTDSLIINESPAGNNYNFIDALVVVRSQASISSDVFVLLDGSAHLEILASAKFGISSQATFVTQHGSPIIALNGIMTVSVPSGTLTSNVKINGTGTIQVTEGAVDFRTTSVAVRSLVIDAKGFVNFIASSVNLTSVSGAGALNISAVGNNSLGTVEIGALDLIIGSVSIFSFSTQTIAIQGGQLTLGASSKTAALRFEGGLIVSKGATIAARFCEIGGPVDQIVDGTHIAANSISLVAGTGALILKNGGTVATAAL